MKEIKPYVKAREPPGSLFLLGNNNIERRRFYGRMEGLY